MPLYFRRGLPALCALLPWSDARPFAHDDASRYRMRVPVEYSQDKPTKEQTAALNKAMEAARAAERQAVMAPAKPKATVARSKLRRRRSPTRCWRIRR